MKRTKLKRFQSFQEIEKEGGAQLKGGTKFWGPKYEFRNLRVEDAKTEDLRVKTTRRFTERTDDKARSNSVVWP